MFAEKVCEQVVGFSAMAENEMFEVNGGTEYSPSGNPIPGTGNNGTSTSGSQPESKPTVTQKIGAALQKWGDSAVKGGTLAAPIDKGAVSVWFIAGGEVLKSVGDYLNP